MQDLFRTEALEHQRRKNTVISSQNVLLRMVFLAALLLAITLVLLLSYWETADQDRLGCWLSAQLQLNLPICEEREMREST